MGVKSREQVKIQSENVIKLSYQERVFGLVRYVFYQVPIQDDPNVTFLEIEQLESHPQSRGKKGAKIRQTYWKMVDLVLVLQRSL